MQYVKYGGRSYGINKRRNPGLPALERNRTDPPYHLIKLSLSLSLLTSGLSVNDKRYLKNQVYHICVLVQPLTYAIAQK